MPDYFTLEEFRTLPDMNNEDKYSDALVERAAAYIESIIERVVGVSFVPRTFTKVLSGTGGDVVLPSPYVLSVASASVSDGSGPGSLVVDNGVLIGPWTRGDRNITVTYDAGYSETPPGDVKEAAMQATRARCMATAEGARIDDRTTQLSNADGGTTTYVLPGVDRPTGYPEVDAIILGWHRRLFGLSSI